jgi:hypothetical protein
LETGSSWFSISSRIELTMPSFTIPNSGGAVEHHDSDLRESVSDFMEKWSDAARAAAAAGRKVGKTMKKSVVRATYRAAGGKEGGKASIRRAHQEMSSQLRREAQLRQ